MWNPSLASVLIFQFLLILPESHSCQKKHLKNLLSDGPGLEPEIHHHNYHHHYDQNGHEIPPPHPQVDILRGGHYQGEGVEQVTAVEDGDYPAKHVVVLQPAPPPPQADEDFFDSIIPKKFHPKHILKHHIHKLRDRFRDLLGDKKPAKHTHHGHHGGGKLGKYQQARGPPPPPPQGPYPYGKVAVPALKVPLVQVEAYKPASPHYHQDPNHPKTVAYVSPDGYQPAVVVKQRPLSHPPPPPPPPHYAHEPHPPPHAHPPPGEAYQYQPVAYEPPQPKGPPPPQHEYPVAYQPQPQHHPVSYLHHPQPHQQPQPQVTVQVQPQVQHVTYASPEESPYHQISSPGSSIYGPQSSSPYSSSPFASHRSGGGGGGSGATSYQHFGPSSSVSYSTGGGASPFASDSSSPYGESSIYQ
ncbi:extensin [Folsomia candida]|uniref:Uncharacterized protein n=1 Tax=Folsomia candida TaxID=158441 RepID=A0A226EE48_FOLCA|nr:extensin [Folsomia candida]OXA55327.1 hypothetical protein Fcan01_09318 [Folsomia candida]